MSTLGKVILFILFAVTVVMHILHHHANAGELWGEYHVGSNHSERYYWDGGKRHEYNEKNTGGGISYGVNNNIEVISGVYRNSYDNTSIYAGADIHTSRVKYLSVGVSAGRITGYDDTPLGTKYMVLPNVVVGNEYSVFRVKVGIQPIGDVKMMTLTVGLNF
jgi:hypothetical protein